MPKYLLDTVRNHHLSRDRFLTTGRYRVPEDIKEGVADTLIEAGIGVRVPAPVVPAPVETAPVVRRGPGRPRSASVKTPPSENKMAEIVENKAEIADVAPENRPDLDE